MDFTSPKKIERSVTPLRGISAQSIICSNPLNIPLIMGAGFKHGHFKFYGRGKKIH